MLAFDNVCRLFLVFRLPGASLGGLGPVLVGTQRVRESERPRAPPWSKARGRVRARGPEPIPEEAKTAKNLKRNENTSTAFEI